MPLGNNNNRAYSTNFLEERVYSILGPVSERVLIETRRQQGVVDSMQKEYEKTKAKEFLGGVEMSKTTLKAIERTFNNIEKISKIIEEAKTATPERLDTLSKELNSTMSQLPVNSGQFNKQWYLSEQEFRNLKVAANNALSERIRRAKTQTASNNTSAKANFENKKVTYDKNNSIKQFFAKLAKKQTQITEDELEEVQKGRVR